MSTARTVSNGSDVRNGRRCAMSTTPSSTAAGPHPASQRRGPLEADDAFDPLDYPYMLAGGRAPIRLALHKTHHPLTPRPLACFTPLFAVLTFYGGGKCAATPTVPRASRDPFGYCASRHRVGLSRSVTPQSSTDPLRVAWGLGCQGYEEIYGAGDLTTHQVGAVY